MIINKILKMNYNQSFAFLNKVCEKISSDGGILTEDSSIILTNMFPKVLSQALSILDQGKVTRF